MDTNEIKLFDGYEHSSPSHIAESKEDMKKISGREDCICFFSGIVAIAFIITLIIYFIYERNDP